MTDDIFDFGFTAVTEDELEYSQKAVAKATQAVDEANSVQERLDNLYNSVIPLLTNLKKNLYCINLYISLIKLIKTHIPIFNPSSLKDEGFK